MNQTHKLIIAVTAALTVATSFAAQATDKDCGCTKTPTSYDKTQDAKIGDVKLTAGQAFDIAVEGRATAGNALTTVYGLIPQVNNNTKGIEDLRNAKVDKSVFTADQARQDKALADSVTNQAAIDSKQSTDLKGYADKKADSAYSTSVAHTDSKVARADADRAKGDAALQTQITGNLAAQSDRDAGQDQHINAVQTVAQNASVHADELAVRADGIEQRAAVTDDRSIHNAVRLDGVEKVNGQQDKMLGNHETRITQNSSDIVQLYSNGEYAQQRIDAANAHIQANRDAITSTNRVVSQHSEQLANHEQRLGNLEQETQKGFASMNRELGKVKKSANAGTSAALSSAAIPQVTEYQTFALGAGVGGYEGEQALAVGFSARVTTNVVMKASVTRDTNQGTGWNVGTSIGW